MEIDIAVYDPSNKILLSRRFPSVVRDTESVEPQFISQEMQSRLMELEGQCRIKQALYLRVNYVKAIILTIVMTISVVGLLLLKYHRRLRALTFYSKVALSNIDEATHVYILDHDKNQQICSISAIKVNIQTDKLVFTFKNLKYQLFNSRYLPLGLRYIDNIAQYTEQTFATSGLTIQQVQQRQLLFGKNQHCVEVPAYFTYLFDVMTQPFFIFQYIVSLIFILESVALFGILMIFFGFFTTSVNHFLLIRSYNKIKETAQKKYKIKVLRNGQELQIQNVDLVPGDLYSPEDEVPCDSIIVKGGLFVDEVSLTGQNVPIAKFQLKENHKVTDAAHWIFEGSKVETKKQDTWAVAIHTGFASRRGRIIRKILTKDTKQPEFFKKLIYFLTEMLLVSIVIYFLTLPQLLKLQITPIMVLFRFFDYITYSFPAPLPIFFNLAYSFCLIRLNRDNIIGTEAEKTVESSRMTTICFDKTGTLTMNSMQIAKIYQFCDGNEINEISQNLKDYPLIENIFASCHSVQLIHGDYRGDEIDLKIFFHTRGLFQASQDTKVIRKISIGGRNLSILKINQYASQFQSMSVLIRDDSTDKHYIFCKGNPEIIHHHSQRKLAGFNQFIQQLSLEGYRSIGFGYREISQQQVERYTMAKREHLLHKITIIGVVTFINQLKEDAKETISALTAAHINTKIITGDNIFLGIQTALLAGIIKPTSKIIVLQGKTYNSQTNSTDVVELTVTDNNEFRERKYRLDDFQFQDRQEKVYAIDNDFIKKREQTFLHDRVKVFARISPQNKGFIIRKHKQNIDALQKRKNRWQRIVGQCRHKVGMVGDGANDMIAIKQADVGIGITNTDAIYSSSFAVRNLSQIIQIIQQSKNTEQQIIELTRYFSVVQFISIVITLLLTSDSSYFTSMQLMYKNFAITIIAPLFMGMSRPAKSLTKQIPQSNFMGWQNHLTIWGNLVIYAVGLTIGYQYYIVTDDFLPNPNTVVNFANGWNGVNKSSTVTFLMGHIIYILLPIFIYRSIPWKQSFLMNKPLSILIALNVIAILIIYFNTVSFGFLGLVPIDPSYAIIILFIMLVTSFMIWLWNVFIEKHSLLASQPIEQQNVKQQIEQIDSAN